MRVVPGIVGTLALVAAGCTAGTSGAEEFDERLPPLVCTGTRGGVLDLEMQLRDMNAHQQNTTQADLVRVEDGRLTQVARIVHEPLGGADLDILLPCSIAEDATYVVDLVADFDDVPGFQPCVRDSGSVLCDDHQWRIPVLEDGTSPYIHDTDFTDIVTEAATPRGTLPLRIEVSGLQADAGRLLEIRLRQPPSSDGTPPETVFLYRRLAIPESGSLSLVHENFVRPGERLEAAMWIDRNDNRRYDAPNPARSDRDYASVVGAIAEREGTLVTIVGSALEEPSDIAIP